jgi:hypothetical protein
LAPAIVQCGTTSSAAGAGSKPPTSSVIAFEPLAAAPGSTPLQLEQWTAIVRASLLTAAPSADEAWRCRDELRQLDGIDATPAFLNALNGLDMSTQDHVARAYNVVGAWQERVGKVPHFWFPDHSRLTSQDVSRRLTSLARWREYWLERASDPVRMAEWRQQVEHALNATTDPEAGQHSVQGVGH